MKVVVQHRVEPESDAATQLVGAGEAAQDDDFLPDAGVAQRHRLADRGDREIASASASARATSTAPWP